MPHSHGLLGQPDKNKRIWGWRLNPPSVKPATLQSVPGWVRGKGTHLNTGPGQLLPHLSASSPGRDPMPVIPRTRSSSLGARRQECGPRASAPRGLRPPPSALRSPLRKLRSVRPPAAGQGGGCALRLEISTSCTRRSKKIKNKNAAAANQLRGPEAARPIRSSQTRDFWDRLRSSAY